MCASKSLGRGVVLFYLLFVALFLFCGLANQNINYLIKLQMVKLISNFFVGWEKVKRVYRKVHVNY